MAKWSTRSGNRDSEIDTELLGWLCSQAEEHKDTRNTALESVQYQNEQSADGQSQPLACLFIEAFSFGEDAFASKMIIYSFAGCGALSFAEDL